MVDSSKFANFTEKAKQNIDQIKIGLLRHDKNPKDREFLNDILKSVQSIKNGAEPLGLQRIVELCLSMESLIHLIREEKKELHQEIIITIAGCRDRFSKFVFELETVQKERAKVKDLVTRIQQHIDDYNTVETPETEAALPDAEPDETQAVEPSKDEIPSLLPEEIINKEYDKELFQIFIEQLQENISLLRSLTDSFADTPRQDMVLSQCSNLVGKLQSSANYMGYDLLADYYLQWVAELEMAGVNLSMGTSLSFEFMDEKIKKIAGLFPEIEDKPADPAKLQAKSPPSSPPPAVEAEKEAESADPEGLEEFFSSMDDGEDEEAGDDIEPIAALAGIDSLDEEEPEAVVDDTKPSPAKKESRAKKIIEIDGSFLEEEKESENYDEELFQIFVEQLKDNISQLQKLTDSFISEPNKSKIIDKCSNLVGKLQSSANYMGYERLAEFYLQWIAELEMTGVEHSIGSGISFDFMQDKIDRISGLFPEAGSKPSAKEKTKTAEETPSLPGTFKKPAEAKKTEAAEKQEAPVYDDLIDDEEEEEPLAEGIEPIAGVAIDETDEGEEAEASIFSDTEEHEGGEFMEALDEKLESFFADIQEPEGDEDIETSFMAIASLSDEDEGEPFALAEEIPFVDVEEGPSAEGIDLIAGISDEDAAESEEAVSALFDNEPVADAEKTGGNEFGDALNEKLETFFTDLEEPSGDEDLEASVMEIASISDETEEEEDTGAEAHFAPAAEIEDLFEGDEEAPSLSQDIASVAAVSTDEDAGEREDEGEDFSEAIDEKFESFFADIEEPEGDEELETSFMEIASTGEEVVKEGPVAFTAEPPADEDTEALFEDEEEEPLAEGIEPIAGLFEEEAAAETEEFVDDEFGDSVEEKLESFFTDLEEPESEEDLETSFMEIASVSDETEEESRASVEDKTPKSDMADLFEEALFEEEPLAEAEEKTSEADMAETVAAGMLGDIDAFFDEEEEPAEGPEEVSFAEAEDISPVAEEIDEDHLKAPEEEEILEGVPPVEETVEETETLASLSDEMLTDEELLEEIKGPTVGEEVMVDAESLIPEIEIAEKVAAALSKDKLDDDELFKKLEGAISEKEIETDDLEDMAAEEEIFDEYEATEAETEAPPERKELFQKLSTALQSLDDETPDIDAFEEVEEKEPVPEPEFDSRLFDRLISALETPSEQADITGARPIDRVMEEILSGTPVKTEYIEQPGKYIEESGKYISKKLAASEIKQIIRMDTDKVDHLMNQVGELNASRSTLSQLFAEMNDLHNHYREMEGFNKQELKPFKDLIFRLGDTSVSLNRLSSEIREGVLKVRMVPISLLFDRYHDFVANLVSGTNKQVEIEIIGEDTELEKLVIDEISEPLTHIISNTMEHGIESVEEREKIGKEKAGKIKLEAYHENNEIVIEVTDDGRGIDLKKVKAKALEQGLFTGDELYKMSDSDLKRLILNPEFSTVTDPGQKPEDRGQGLHIVKTNIEKLKGSIDIRSKAGKGTIIQIRVPLELLVIKALQVKAGEEIMALPVNCVEEILKVSNAVIFEEDGIKAITFHDETLPVFKLTEVFSIEPSPGHDDKVYIIVVQADKQSIGLIVDETAGIEEIVIKPIGEFLRKESGFSGATVINDGNISLIPDIAELIKIAKKRRTVTEESVA